jgi:hypothetical protein
MSRYSLARQFQNLFRLRRPDTWFLRRAGFSARATILSRGNALILAVNDSFCQTFAT